MSENGPFTELHFAEDLNPRKRRISFSSTDSEPITKEMRNDERSCSSDDPGVLYSPAVTSDRDDVESVRSVVSYDQVSEAHIAVIVSVSKQKAMIVAEIENGACPVDVGTRLCLEDGTYAGTVSSIFGPVREPLCAAKMRDESNLLSLIDKGILAPGKQLHYDVLHHNILYNPLTQCDTTAGTDASYINDEELPDNVCPEFSDDEKEHEWMQKNKSNKIPENVVVPTWLLPPT